VRVFGSFVLALALTASINAHPQSTLPIPECEASPEVRAALDSTLSQDSLAKLQIKERVALQQHVLEELLAKYPHEYSLYVQQIDLAQQQRWYASDPSSADAAKQKYNALRDRWVKNAKEHPDDPLALLLAGKILIGKDTPEALRLMEAAKAKAPGFPWPAHELAMEYRWEKFADGAKMKENLERFYSLCPAWTADTYYDNSIDGFMLQKDLPLMARTAVALRARLEKETDPKRLEDYQILWQREFLTRPPSEHDAIRAQIRRDLKRLEAVVPSGDAAWRSFLIEGYKLSGASNEELTRMQDAAARDFPHEGPAFSQVWEQFDKEHPLPDGQKDAEAWKSYYAAKIEVMKKILHDFPDIVFAQRSEFFQIALDDEYISREDGLAALDRYEQAMKEYGGFGTLSFMPSDPPRFLLDHGWQPERALELLKKTSTYRDGGHSKEAWSDDIADADVKRFERNQDFDDRATLGLILKAAALSGKPEEALKLRSAIEEPPPAGKGALEQYWTNRARFAALDKRPEDALIYYRLALDSRTHPPEYHHGLLRDDLMSEFRGLWKAQGGTETAWKAWTAPTSVENSNAEKAQSGGEKEKAATSKGNIAVEKKKPAPQGDWQDAPKDLPLFQLSDFSGKTWRLSDLKGKVVMITSWATWCGPCRLEDQSLEKFYQKEKDRKDLAILTFNVNDNPGEVLPFMQKQGYKFPVLAAFSIPEKMRELVPRTWIIDPNGHWLWVKNGYDESQAYADFEKEMLDRIERAKVAR
jgi:thiol-disulfide isomerase/thioredoxin